MVKKPIRDLHSSKPTPSRFCDVIIEGEKIFLEKKTDRKTYERISWEDVVYQVEAAKNIDKEQKLPQIAP